MASRETPLINTHFYHVIFRGIDGRKIFQDDQDYYRMVHDMFEFNDDDYTLSTYRLDQWERELAIKNRRKRDFLVRVHAFCLMSNHVHLILEQVKEEGISKFMHKLCGGYSRFFNCKYKRKGHLFQDKFKSVHIADDTQFNFLFVYVHTNPIAIFCPDWKNSGIDGNEKDIIDFVENYKWSSYRDYLLADNFPSVTQREFFLEINTKEKWQEFVNDWVLFKKEIFDLEKNRDIALEDDF